MLQRGAVFPRHQASRHQASRHQAWAVATAAALLGAGLAVVGAPSAAHANSASGLRESVSTSVVNGQVILGAGTGDYRSPQKVKASASKKSKRVGR